MIPVSFEEVKNRVDLALNNFRERDLQLLELCADERAATHRIACYLQKYFADWHVDCEYNRKGRQSKKINDELVRPDIIVHRRNTFENLLCIEAKKAGGSTSDINEDRKKLRGFTEESGEYSYKFGLLMIFSLEIPYVIKGEWYQDGKKRESVVFPVSQDVK
jgi:hypothetical protein